jgi:hypothetical protein
VVPSLVVGDFSPFYCQGIRLVSYGLRLGPQRPCLGRSQALGNITTLSFNYEAAFMAQLQLDIRIRADFLGSSPSTRDAKWSRNVIPLYSDRMSFGKSLATG